MVSAFDIVERERKQALSADADDTPEDILFIDQPATTERPVTAFELIRKESAEPTRADPLAEEPRRSVSAFDLIDREGTLTPAVQMKFQLQAPGIPQAEQAQQLPKGPIQSLMEKPIEHFRSGVSLGEAGMRSLLNVPGVREALEIPGEIVEAFGGDPKKFGLDIPEAQQILPELPEGTPQSLRPFLEYARATIDPAIGAAATLLGPVASVYGFISELLYEAPARTAIESTIKKFRDDPESVPIGAVAPIAITALREAGFSLEDEDVKAISESAASLSAVLFSMGLGNALLKSANPGIRALGRVMGGEPEKKPVMAIGPGQAPFLPRADTIIAKLKKQFTPKHSQSVAFDQMSSEMAGSKTLGMMHARRQFHTLEDAISKAGKETGRTADDLRVDLGNYLKGEGVQLPPSMQKPALVARDAINRLQQEAADAGLISQGIVDQTLDQYLYRGYLSKIAPETWDPPAPVLMRAREYLRQNMRVPVSRDDPARAAESIALEGVRKEMQTNFRSMIKEGTPDVGLAQRVTDDLKRAVVGNEKANLRNVHEFLGTEGNPTTFRKMLSERLQEKWNLSPQETAGTIRSAINALSRRTIAVDWKDLRGAMFKEILKKEGVRPEIAGAIEKTMRDTRSAFDEMRALLVQTRKGRLTQKEIQILERKFQETLEKATGKGPLSFRRPTPDEVEGAVEKILSGDDAFGFHAVQGGQSARINLGPFTRRKDIPKEIRDLMGEINEGSTATALTISNLSRAVAAKKFLDRFSVGSEIIEFGGVRQQVPWVSQTRVPGYVKVDGRAWGPLDGKFVLEKYADDLKGFVEQMSPDGMMSKLQAWMMNFFKVSKTIMSPATHMRNVLGNTMFADYAKIPVWDLRNAKYYAQAANELLASGRGFTAKGLRAIRQGVDLTDEGVSPLVREAIQNGAIHTEMFGSEVFKEVLDVFTKKTPMKAISELAKRPVKALGRVYNSEDQIFKLASYIKQRELGMSAAEASTHVRKWFPNYRDVAPIVEKTRRSLLGAPFVTFYSEAIRINMAAARKHPIKFGKWIMMAPAMTEGARAALGITREKWEEVKKTLPDYLNQPPTVPWPYKDSDGNFQVFDMTYVHPLGSIMAARRQGMDLPLIGEFVLNNPILNTALEVAQDIDPFTGGPSRDPGQPISAWLTELLIKNFAPSLTPGIPGTEIEGGPQAREISRAIRRAGGERVPGRFGQSPSLLRTIINELGPIRVTPVDMNMIAMAARQKKGRLHDLYRGLRTLGMQAAKGRIKTETVQDRADRIMREMRDIFGKQIESGARPGVKGPIPEPKPPASAGGSLLR